MSAYAERPGSLSTNGEGYLAYARGANRSASFGAERPVPVVQRVQHPHAQPQVEVQRAGPAVVLFRGATHEIVRHGDGYEAVLNLPLAEKKDLDLSKRGAELFVRVGAQRRNILLPDSMSRLFATGASIDDGRLRVRLDNGVS